MAEYIEREALLAAYDAEHVGPRGRARELIANAPAADVRPVVRSEWVLNDNRTWSCKRCHSWIPDEQRYYANYCLFCGADMREKAT